MISLLMAAGAFAAQAPAAPGPRTLQSLPGVTVQYYDVPGTDADTIKKSLDKILKAPAPNTAAAGYDWSLNVAINKHTVGTTCTVTSATATLKGNVYLPRLTGGSRVPADVAKSFGDYEQRLEKRASDNLWFVANRLPALQQSLVGKPCDSVSALWNQATATLSSEQKAFASSQAQTQR